MCVFFQLRVSEIQAQQQQLNDAKSKYRVAFASLDVITAAQVAEGDILPQLGDGMDMDPQGKISV